MATAVIATTDPTAVAKSKREGSNSRKMWQDFTDWCTASSESPNPVLLMEWDVKHNDSKIRALFGSYDDVYQAGLLALYTRFFHNMNMIRVDNPKGKGTLAVSQRRYIPGDGYVDMTSTAMTSHQLASIQAKADAVAYNAVARLKFFKLTKKEIRDTFNKAIEALED